MKHSFSGKYPLHRGRGFESTETSVTLPDAPHSLLELNQSSQWVENDALYIKEIYIFQIIFGFKKHQKILKQLND